jgi:cytochrome d ubiquinol oxidase subunit II
MNLEVFCVIILSSIIFSYVILDGFNLGIGINYPFIKAKWEKSLVIKSSSTSPYTAVILLFFYGLTLLFAFPLAFVIIIKSLYIPLSFLLVGLILRYVALEFLIKYKSQLKIWDLIFIFGSYISSFFQGVSLGAFVQGIKVDKYIFNGEWLDWLSPFSIFIGFALVIGYGLLGSSWLIYKTENRTKRNMQHLARKFFSITLIMIVIVSIWTPFLHVDYFDKWFSVPRIYYVIPVPLLVLLSSIMCFKSLYKNDEIQPFLWSILLFLLSFIGLVISIYPNTIPPSLTMIETAASKKELKILIFGIVFLIPVFLTYKYLIYKKLS